MYLDIQLNGVYNFPTVPHLYVLPLASPRNDYLQEDFLDEDETNAPVRAAA